MTIVEIKTLNEIHHTCLLYGLKRAYMRFPMLVHNPLASPPPVRRNPERRPLLLGGGINPVSVQYYGCSMRVLCSKAGVAIEDVMDFARAVVDEYVALRHPYVKAEWQEESLVDMTSGTSIVALSLLS